jgi:hypothetical protein
LGDEDFWVDGDLQIVLPELHDIIAMEDQIEQVDPKAGKTLLE